MMVVVGLLAIADGLDDVTNDLAAVVVQVLGGDTKSVEFLDHMEIVVYEMGEQGIRELTKEVFRENLLLLVDSIS